MSSVQTTNSAGIDVEKEHKQGRSWKHNIFYLVIMVHMLELALIYFLISEYIQETLKKEAFPNGSSDANFTGCRDKNHSSPDYQKYSKVQEETGKWTVYNGAAEYGIATLSNVLLTSYTDSYGRKFLFVTTVFGAGVKAVLMSGIIYFKLSFEYIVLASGLNGLTGSAYSFFAASFVFFADITVTKKQMLVAVTITESLILLFSTIGSLLSGILIDSVGFFIPALACVCLSIIALLLVVCLLPETLPTEKRHRNHGALKIISRTVEFYTSDEFKGHRLAYLFLILAFFFIQLIANNRGGIETVYLLGMPFCWQPHQVSYFTSLRFSVQGFGGVLVLKLAQMCISNDALAVASALASAGTLVQEALARSVLVLYLVAIPSVISFLCVPLIRGTMSAMTSPDKQGSLFSSIATVEVASSLVATLSENSIYSATVAVSNSFVFYVMAGFSATTAIFLCLYTIVKPRPGYDVIKDIDEDDAERIQNAT